MVGLKQLIILSLALLITGLMISCANSVSNTENGTGTIVDDGRSNVLDDDEIQDTIIPDSLETDTLLADIISQSNDTLTASVAPTKRALVIGIGKYQDSAWSEIHGDQDVPIVKQMLNNCGYSNIYTLTNAQATRARIVSMFSKLCCQCNTGDIVYIHFSGHGQQVTDVDGDEDDGWDEAWIPYDARHAYCEDYKGENHLIDDEISSWLTKIRKKLGEQGQLLIVADACHSGDSTRDRLDDNIYVRGTDDDFIIPMSEKPRKRDKSPEKWITLSACLDYQVNCEVCTASGEFYGMLSYALCSKYRDFASVSNDILMDVISEFVEQHRGFMPQQPKLSGAMTETQLSTFFR